MKKTLLFLALIMMGISNAQKGTILVAGNINFNTFKQDQGETNVTNSSFSFNPKIGYQFHDKWIVGVTGGISSGKRESTTPAFLIFSTSTEDKTSGYSAGAFVRYSRQLNEIFSVYADLSAGYNGGKITASSFNGLTSTVTENKFNGLYTDLTPAVFINIKKNFGLNFSIGGLGYRQFNYDVAGSDSSEIYFNFGQSFSIGVQKNF